MTAHRCAGGLKKKLNLRPGSQRHSHFEGFFYVPVQAPTKATLLTVIPRNHPISVAFYDAYGDTEDLLQQERLINFGTIWETLQENSQILTQNQYLINVFACYFIALVGLDFISLNLFVSHSIYWRFSTNSDFFSTYEISNTFGNFVTFWRKILQYSAMGMGPYNIPITIHAGFFQRHGIFASLN